MAIKELYHFTPLNVGEMRDTFQHINRFYDLARMQDKFIEVYVFVKDKSDESPKSHRRTNPSNPQGETSFQN